MNLRKAAQAVVERWDTPSWKDVPATAIYIEALRQALAQPEQEPVGYVTDSGMSAYFLKGVDLDDDTPLYAAPPKQWVGLTDADIAQTMHGSVEGSNMLPYQFARVIEAKLKEKNGG
jgi:hypothetical protein